MLRTISCFAGIGGFSLAAKALGGFDIALAIEINPYRQQVLKKNFPGLKIHDDICTYNTDDKTDKTDKIVSLPIEDLDLLITTFPCKGMSAAGKGEGFKNKHSFLWWESFRLIEQLKPKFVVIENVAGFINRGLRECIASLEMAGYQVDPPQIVSAKELGAPHERKRVFVVAYSHGLEWREQPTCWSRQIGGQIARVKSRDNHEYDPADSSSFRQQSHSKSDCYPREQKLAEVEQRSYQTRSRSESGGSPVSCGASTTTGVQFPPFVSGVSDGISFWMDGYHRDGWWLDNPFVGAIAAKRNTISDRQKRISALGDACTPQQASIPLMRVKYLHSLWV